MDRNSTLADIEYQVAVFIRRATLGARDTGDLDRSAYLFLNHLYDNGSMGVKDVAQEFHLDISTISRQAASLQQKGYVRRLSDSKDRRACRLVITEAGLKKLQDQRQKRRDLYQALLSGWSDHDTDVFRDLLTRLNQTFLD